MSNTIDYINFNGTLVSSDTPIINAKNRAFMYGDALFESMRCINNKVMLLDMHYQRLISGMRVLKLNVPRFFSPDFIEAAAVELIKKNNAGRTARVRMQIYRNEGGLYTPEQYDVSYVMYLLPAVTDDYWINQAGLKVNIFPDVRKTRSILSPFKTSNALIYVLAGLWKKQQGLDDCLIINDQGYVIESTSANYFIVRGGQFFTPPIDDGCIAGVMRDHVIILLRAAGKEVIEHSLEIHDLMEADEFFFTNAAQGIKWVGAFRNKRYFKKESAALVEMLNQNILV